jgi:hypothetical protein
MLTTLMYLQAMQRALNVVQEQIATSVVYVEENDNENEAVYTAEEVREVLCLKDYEYIHEVEYTYNPEEEEFSMVLAIAGNVRERENNEVREFTDEEFDYRYYRRVMTFDCSSVTGLNKINYLMDFVESKGINVVCGADNGMIICEAPAEFMDCDVYVDFGDILEELLDQWLYDTAREIYVRE